MRAISILIFFSISLNVDAYNADSLLEHLSKASEKEQIVLLSNLPTDICYSGSKESIELLDEGILIAQKNENPFLRIDLMLCKVQILEQQDQRIEGLNLLAEIQNLSQKHSYLEGEAKGYKLLGDFYFNIKDYENSIVYYIKSIDVYRSIKDEANLGLINYNLGLIYRSMWQNTEALVYLKEAYSNSVANNQQELQAEVESLMGCTYIRIGELDSSIAQLKQSRASCKKNKLESIDVYVAKSLAVAYNLKGQHNKALQEIDYCLALTQKLNLQTEYVEYLNIKAEIEKNRGNYTEAIRLALLSRDKAEERHLKEIHVDGLRILTESYIALGENKLANTYFQEYHPLRNALEWERNYQQTADMQVKYDTERRIADKQTEIIILDQRLKRERAFKYLLFLVSILLIITGLLIINRWKLRNKALHIQKQKALLKRENLEIEIRAKNQELSATTAFIAEKNKMLFDLKGQMILLKELNKDKKCELDSLSREINRNINLDKDWQTMKMHFENVFPDFFTLLTSKYPKLTPLDLKHCAYLKMKLSNKELARILNIEPNSVKTLRYRLKKKLNLNPEEDLFSFVEMV